MEVLLIARFVFIFFSFFTTATEVALDRLLMAQTVRATLSLGSLIELAFALLSHIALTQVLGRAHCANLHVLLLLALAPCLLAQVGICLILYDSGETECKLSPCFVGIST